MRKILMFLMLLITTLLTAQTISEVVVIRKAQGGGGADSLYINGTWYNIPADTITISAVPSANAFNSDSLGGFAPATYIDTIFYNGSWIGQNDTLYLGFDATDIAFLSSDNNNFTGNVFSKNTPLNFRGFMNRDSTDVVMINDSVYAVFPINDNTMDILIGGKKYSYTDTLTIDITTASSNILRAGVYLIYMDDSTGLKVTKNCSGVRFANDYIIVGYVGVDTTQAVGSKSVIGDERHTDRITYNDHEWKHEREGAILINGGAISGYTLNTSTNKAVTYGLAGAIIKDEDVKHILDLLPDSNGTTAQYFNLYKTPTGYRYHLSDMPYGYLSGGYIYYNDITNDSGKVQVSNGNFVNTYVLFTNFKGHGRFIIITSQTQYTTLALAQQANFSDLNLTGFPIEEAVVVWKLTYRGRSIYNTVKGQTNLVAAPVFIDRNAQLTLQGVVSNDHNSLINRDALNSHPATAISTTANINSFTNMQNVTNYVDSLELNFQKQNDLEAVATIFAGTGTNALCRSVIAYTYNDTDYIAVANASTTAGGIRIYNSNFEQVAVVARNGIEFLTYDNVANRIYATTKSNILYSYNYIGGDEKSLNYTATTIVEVTNPVIARNTVDSSTVWLYGRESTNLWRAYRITIANATKTIQNTIKTDSIVESVTLDQLVISETRDTIWIANSSGSRNRFLRAIYNAGAVTHTTINVLASSLTGASQSASGAVRIGGYLYVNWQYAFTKHTIGSLATKKEWGFGSIITENQMFYLSSINKIATLRRAFADNPQQIYLVDLENPYKHSVITTHASGLVGQDTKNKYIFGAFVYVNAFVIIYKHK